MHFSQDIEVSLRGSGFKININATGHILTADEPVDKGGSDEGASPHELLLASLGACTAITVRMYANRKGWDLKSVDVSLNLEKTVEDGKQTTAIFQKIKLTGNLSDEERKRLLEIGNKCPVHKTLESEIKIISQTKQ